MAKFSFKLTDEAPPALAKPGRTAEVTAEQEEVLAAFQDSIKNGTGDGPAFIGKTVKVTVPDIDATKELRKLVQWAAKKEDMGSRFRLAESGGKGLNCFFWAVPLTERLYVDCPMCHKQVQVTEDHTVRVHGPKDNRCKASGAEVAVD